MCGRSMEGGSIIFFWACTTVLKMIGFYSRVGGNSKKKQL